MQESARASRCQGTSLDDGLAGEFGEANRLDQCVGELWLVGCVARQDLSSGMLGVDRHRSCHPPVARPCAAGGLAQRRLRLGGAGDAPVPISHVGGPSSPTPTRPPLRCRKPFSQRRRLREGCAQFCVIVGVSGGVRRLRLMIIRSALVQVVPVPVPFTSHLSAASALQGPRPAVQGETGGLRAADARTGSRRRWLPFRRHRCHHTGRRRRCHPECSC